MISGHDSTLRVHLWLSKMFVQISSVILFALLSPIYYLNKWDFKRNTKKNPVYTSKLVQLLERYPILYELAMFVQNFPVPHHVYKVLPEFTGSVLQIGCGTGLLNKYLKHRNDIHFVNLDPNINSLRVGFHLKRFSSYINGSIDQIVPFPNESFDIVLFARSFHHVRHHKRAFQECARLLRNGGYVIIADPVVLDNKTTKRFRSGYMANSSIDGVIWRFTKDTFIDHVRNLLPSSLELSSVECKRQLHVTNFNLFVPQTDLVAIIRKKAEIDDLESLAEPFASSRRECA